MIEKCHITCARDTCSSNKGRITSVPYFSFWWHMFGLASSAEQNHVHPAKYSAAEVSWFDWVTGDWRTVLIFFSYTISYYSLAPQDEAQLCQIWSNLDKMTEQQRVELGFYMFIGSDDFSLFMFVKHTAAKPLQKRLSVFSQMFWEQWFISLWIKTTPCICIWADTFMLNFGTRVYFGLRKTWINSVIWMLFITSQHTFYFSKHATALIFAKDSVSSCS